MIDIIITEHDSEFISNKKRRLLKKFRDSSEKDIDNANVLSVFLTAHGRKNEAVGLLKSYIPSLAELDGDHRAWASVTRGILHLIYLEGASDSNLVIKAREFFYENPFGTDYEYFDFLVVDYEAINQYYKENGDYNLRVSIVAEYYMMLLYFIVIPSSNWERDLAKEAAVVVESIFASLKDQLIQLDKI